MSVVQEYFSLLADFKFGECINLVNRVKEQNSKLQKWLGHLTVCENEYYKTRFGSKNTFSLQKRYSFLSSQIFQLKKGSPFEYSGEHNLRIGSDYMIDYSSSSGLVLSHQLWNTLINFLMVRERLCSLYESISHSKTPHSYDYFCKEIILTTQTMLISHIFLKKIKENISRELEILYKSFRCESYIDKLRFTECVYVFWQVKESFLKWKKIHKVSLPTPKKKDETKEKEILSPSTTFNPKMFKQIKDKHMLKTTTSSFRIIRKFFTPSPGSNRKRRDKRNFITQNKMMFEKTKLENTNLFKWFYMLHGYTFSKYTFFFHDILIKYEQSSSIFKKIYSDVGLNYIDKITRFCKEQDIFTSVILYNSNRVYNDQKFTTQFDPEFGYSMENSVNLKDCLKEKFVGKRGYPCLYFYSTDHSYSKELMFNDFWHSIMQLLEKDSKDLEGKLKPIYLADVLIDMEFYYLRIGEEIFLVLLKKRKFFENEKEREKYIRENSKMPNYKPNKEIVDFMYNLNLFLQNVRLFSFLSKPPE